MSALAAALAQVLPPPPVFAAAEPPPERAGHTKQAGGTERTDQAEGGVRAVVPAFSPEEPTPVSSATGEARRTRKLWELDDKLHCPLIGTCPPMEQPSRLARRFGFKCDLQDYYQLHVEAVDRSLYPLIYGGPETRHAPRSFRATPSTALPRQSLPAGSTPGGRHSCVGQ